MVYTGRPYRGRPYLALFLLFTHTYLRMPVSNAAGILSWVVPVHAWMDVPVFFKRGIRTALSKIEINRIIQNAPQQHYRLHTVVILFHPQEPARRQ